MCWRASLHSEGEEKIMQMKIYAVRTQYGWHPGMTLDWHVDVRYWLSGDKAQAKGSKLVFLQPTIPIQIAMSVLEQFMSSEGMDRWERRDWIQFFAQMITPHIVELEAEIGKRLCEDNLQVVIMEPPYLEPASNLLIMEKKTITYRVTEREATDTAKEKPIMEAIENNNRKSLSAIQFEISAQIGATNHPIYCKNKLSLPASLYADMLGFATMLRGRLLLEEELVQLLRNVGYEHLIASRNSLIQSGCLHGWLEVRTGITMQRHGRGCLRKHAQYKNYFQRVFCSIHNSKVWISCGRCGSKEGLRSSCCSTCGSKQCLTCTNCLELGRCRSCALLIIGKFHRGESQTVALVPSIEERLEKWKLSSAQIEASRTALQYIAANRWNIRKKESVASIKTAKQLWKREFLLWAVTGAGKTEMLFPLIEDAMIHGEKIIIATPRRDVVFELQPRIKKAFPKEKVVSLYGGSAERWVEGEIMLTTTHQLLRFEALFDLIIIDEVDSFPYQNNDMLQRAAKRACCEKGIFIFLSATPPHEMQQNVKKGRLACAKIPVRFHGHPLPVPVHIRIPPMSFCLNKSKLPNLLLVHIYESINRGAQLFVFIAHIHKLDKLVQLLQKHFPNIVIAGTFATDHKRNEKVVRFRKRDIRILVTTTILERGVTIPRSDVFVFDSDHRLFNTAALIQMAGRAGRSKEDPFGKVVFGSPQWTRSQRKAVKEIKQMNQLAHQCGYLCPVDKRERWIS